MAWLLLQPSISSASTILGYEVHTKYMFKEWGCDPERYKTAFGQIRRGIKNVLPCLADKRTAFLLPHHMNEREFIGKDTTDQLNTYAVILGFVGMLRPHTFHQLKVNSIKPVTAKRTIVQTDDVPSYLRSQERNNISGFFFEFKANTMRYARAYFLNLSTPRSPYSAMVQ